MAFWLPARPALGLLDTLLVRPPPLVIIVIIPLAALASKIQKKKHIESRGLSLLLPAWIPFWCTKELESIYRKAAEKKRERTCYYWSSLVSSSCGSVELQLS